MVKYGVVRKGEHTKLFNTREEAEAQVKADKASDIESEKAGWGNKASDTWYRIEKVTRLPW